MDDEYLLTTKELAALLRTTTAHIYNITSKDPTGDALPRHIRFGRKKLWVKSEVLRWLNERLQANKNRSKEASAVSSGPKLNKL
ncbi:hypothetical protein C6Y40_02390 [Alteromonas alba]|uniref:Uncharacterized protein n=1 Tax=Alteromonas alba TaxID=2079529 RepID=A0A2S9VFV9_9ALTE|nr:helix-turn-helix domain-containing protein [Alteromonas alba]PRO75185.1 hypothetical protein C6Y40_02390 [Alteromonas alba]